jgi:hypothetical protein
MATTIQSGRANSPLLTADVASRAEVYGGRGLVFDGVMDYLNCGSSSSLDDIWSGGGTLSAWIYPHSDGESNFGMIANKRGGGSVGWIFHLNDESSGSCDLRFYQYRATTAGDWITTSREVTINAWNHIVISFDSDNTSNNPSIYVNGTLVSLTQTGSQSGAITSDASVDMHIGGEAGAYTFDGAISDFKIHSSALTEAEITSQYLKPESVPSSSTLVAWYPMSEGLAQSVAYDHSGNNNHAVEGGGSSYTLAVAQNEPVIPQVPLMKYAEKMIFDGSDDKVTLSGSSPSSAFTISSWVIDNHPSGSDFSAIYSTASLYIWFGVDNNSTTGKVRIHLNGTPYADTPNGSFEANKLTHIVATWDAIGGGTNNINGVKIYINGTSQTLTVVNSLSTPTASTDHKIGMYGSTNQWNGLIDETSIFNTALTQTQVTELYNSGTALDATTHSKSGNLLSYHRNDGVTTWKDRRGWNYLDFDGNDNIATNLNSTPADATYIWWMKSTGTNTNPVFGHGLSSQTGFILNWAGTNKPLLYLNSSNYRYFSLNDAQDDGAWHCFALVNDNDDILNAKLYIDGVEQSATSTTYTGPDPTHAHGLKIGYAGSYFNGSIAQFAVYSDLKDSSFITSKFNQGINSDLSSDSNLIAYYKMDNTSTIIDLVGSNNGTVTGTTLNTGNNGTVAGSPDSITIREAINSNKDGLGFPLKNPTGNVLRLNGSSEYLELPVSKGLQSQSALTLEAWIKCNPKSTAGAIIAKDDTTNRVFNLTVLESSSGSANKVIFNIYSGGSAQSVTSTSVVADGNWHHIAGTFEPSTKQVIYVDGVAETTDTSSIPSSIDLSTDEANTPIRIGNFENDALYFEGLLDEVKLYNKALSASEILKNYKHQKGKHKND